MAEGEDERWAMDGEGEAEDGRSIRELGCDHLLP